MIGGLDAMEDVSKMTMEELVEFHRRKGGSESDPWLSELPLQIGTLVAGMSYLESYAGQIAGPWIENVMSEEELWDFSLISSFDRVDQCAISIQKSLDALRGQKDTEWLACHVDDIWVPLRGFIDALKASKEPEGFAWRVLTFLVAAMVMRQDLEIRIRPRVNVFLMGSDSICRQYMEMAIAKAGGCPFGCRDGISIDSLRQALIEGLAQNES